MWVVLAFFSALCLGGYDISKKIALRQYSVQDVLTLSILISSLILLVPLLLSRLSPEWVRDSLLYVPKVDLRGHGLILLKSCIVLSSWVFAYISLQHLPLSVVSPMQATRPMWTLVGAMLIFGERLNGWQWLGVVLAMGSVFAVSFKKHPNIHLHNNVKAQIIDNRYYICLALAILIGSCSGLYDKYMMRNYDHNAVQVYYTLYQAIIMVVYWLAARSFHKAGSPHSTPTSSALSIQTGERTTRMSLLPIAFISIFLVISDNVYMLALQDPDSLIAVVSTIRRGGAVIGFAYGLLFLHEPEPKKKIICMVGIMLGLTCLALGSC